MQNQHPQGAPLPPAYGPGNPLSTGPFPPNPYPQGPMPPADDGWGKIGVLMVLVALAFAGGVAYFIATSESSEQSAAAEGEEAVAAATVDGDASAGEATAADSGAAEQDPEVIPDGGVAAALIAAGELQDSGVAEVATDSADAGPDPLRANGEVDRPAGLVSMSIESEPSGAQVIRKSDGVRLGLTPYRYEVESASGDVVFIIKLEGYRSMSLPMPADRDSERQVMLFPGKGGAPIPVAPEQSAMATPEPKKAPEEKPATEATTPKTTPKKIAKPSKPKRPTRPKRPKKPVKPKKPRGTVDYSAEPIPLD